MSWRASERTLTLLERIINATRARPPPQRNPTAFAVEVPFSLAPATMNADGAAPATAPPNTQPLAAAPGPAPPPSAEQQQLLQQQALIIMHHQQMLLQAAAQQQQTARPAVSLAPGAPSALPPGMVIIHPSTVGAPAAVALSPSPPMTIPIVQLPVPFEASSKVKSSAPPAAASGTSLSQAQAAAAVAAAAQAAVARAAALAPLQQRALASLPALPALPAPPARPWPVGLPGPSYVRLASTSVAPGLGMPPSCLPPGSLPPGSLPPGSLPPGTFPPGGTLPPGYLPQGYLQPWMMPPAGLPQAGIPPPGLPQGSAMLPMTGFPGFARPLWLPTAMPAAMVAPRPAPAPAAAPKGGAGARGTKQPAAGSDAKKPARKKRKKWSSDDDESDEESDASWAGKPSASRAPRADAAEGGRPRRQAAQDAMIKTDMCRSLEKASAETFVKEAHALMLQQLTSQEREQRERENLQGEYAGKFIRVGDEFQADVAELVEGELPPPSGEESDTEERGDSRVEIEYTPLAEPPKSVPILTLEQVKAAERAAAALADAAPAPATSSPAAADGSSVELRDFDEGGEPLLPTGVVLGGFCRAIGKRAGERIPFKAVLLSTRRTSPHLLVKYVGTSDGREAHPNSGLLPESLKAFLSCVDVSAWVEPAKPPPELITLFGLPSAAAERKFRARPASAEPKLELLTEAGGLRLHLDPRRNIDGYTGTGYAGVFNDYWPTGFKKFKPFVVTYEGRYAGRFATVEHAAVQYARLDEGLPPLHFDARAEFEANMLG